MPICRHVHEKFGRKIRRINEEMDSCCIFASHWLNCKRERELVPRMCEHVSISRWWFEPFSIFYPYLGTWSNFNQYFSVFLKPPTRFVWITSIEQTYSKSRPTNWWALRMEAVGFVRLKDSIHTKPLQIHMPLEIHRFSTLRKIPL